MVLRRVHSGGGLYLSLERRKGNWIASRTGFSRCQRFNHRSAINASRPSFPGAFHYGSLKRRLESSRFQAPSHPGESGHCRNYLIITSDTGDTREKKRRRNIDTENRSFKKNGFSDINGKIRRSLCSKINWRDGKGIIKHRRNCCSSFL